MTIDNQIHPWKYQTEVTVQAFRKFLETKPSQEELDEVYDKMSLANRAGIPKGDCDALEKAAKIWEEHLQDLRAESLAVLMDSLTKASEIVQLYREAIAN